MHDTTRFLINTPPRRCWQAFTHGQHHCVFAVFFAFTICASITCAETATTAPLFSNKFRAKCPQNPGGEQGERHLRFLHVLSDMRAISPNVAVVRQIYEVTWSMTYGIHTASAIRCCRARRSSQVHPPHPYLHVGDTATHVNNCLQTGILEFETKW